MSDKTEPRAARPVNRQSNANTAVERSDSFQAEGQGQAEGQS